MELLLIRHVFTPISTIGELLLADAHVCWTIERPWMGGLNERGKSAILEGRYRLRPYKSPHLGYVVLLLEGVPGRDKIEMHIANWAHELLGCIAPGLEKGTDQVFESAKAFLKLMGLADDAFNKGQEVWLTVKNGNAQDD